MDLDKKLARRFVCSKCQGEGAKVKRIAVTGSGLSRFVNLQHNQFVAVSCKRCGYTDLFDQAIMAGRDEGVNVLDLLFGA